MAETNLAFSKIVSTPTSTAWSQAYSAGRLFAALSLSTDIIPQEGDEHLTSIGKDLISTLESEFFTLENKDLDSIKQAIVTTLGRVKEGIKSSLVICFLAEDVLYLFATGGGKAVLKRGEKIGTVIEGNEDGNIKSASGYVKEEDIIILQTKPFLRIIAPSLLASSINGNNPEEIVEELAPHVHEKSEGGAAAVILVYKKEALQDLPPLSIPEINNEGSVNQGIENLGENQNVQTIQDDEDIAPIKDFGAPLEQQEQTPPVEEQIKDLSGLAQETISQSSSPFLTDQRPRRSRMSLGIKLGFLKNLPRQRRVILIIAVVLAILIVFTSFLALSSKQNSQNKKLFDTVFQQANSKYEEGQNLKDLNASLAQSSFKDAKKILEDNKAKFKQGSTEEKQIGELLNKVDAQISNASTGESVAPQEAKITDSKILSYEINNADAGFFIQNADKVFFLDGTGVSSIDKGNEKKAQVIKKSWKSDGGIGLFGANVYVLDRSDGILKFVASSSGYSKTDYFPDTAPDFSKSQAMAIDGSVYILFKDGTIDKYTRAKKDTFAISGLDKPLSSPTKIFTDADTDNLYILDNGNSRIVELDKSGKFKSAYSANVIKKAKDFEVKEKDKKIFVLSSGKIYLINLK